MQHNSQTDNDKLGFRFHPKLDPHDPGYPGLDIFLHADPTGQHFDPERVGLTIAAVTPQSAGTEHLSIHHGWHGLDHYTVCASRIILHDRGDKIVEAFTFGGEVHITSEPGLTTVSLVSSAPILNLVHKYPLSIPLRLASEVEVLLAQRRAEWAQRDPARFKLLLADVDPRTLYNSCLLALSERFAHFPKTRTEEIGQFIHFLQGAVQELKKAPVEGQAMPMLSELL
nr:hypothetical protein [Anaerolineae bacterium]